MRRVKHWGNISIVKASYALKRLGEHSTHMVIEYPFHKTLRGKRVEDLHCGFSGSLIDCLRYVEQKYGIDTRMEWEKEKDND